jgi:hypothetical protein
MKTVSARQANHDFSELLSRVERGEEARGVIVPLSPAAADTGTASSHRSCNRGHGTGPTVGRTSFHAR